MPSVMAKLDCASMVRLVSVPARVRKEMLLVPLVEVTVAERRPAP